MNNAFIPEKLYIGERKSERKRFSVRIGVGSSVCIIRLARRCRKVKK